MLLSCVAARRFVTGRPVSDITTQFLEWCCTQVQEQGKTAWLLIWDNTSWHNSKKVRSWIREHNLLIKKEMIWLKVFDHRCEMGKSVVESVDCYCQRSHQPAPVDG